MATLRVNIDDTAAVYSFTNEGHTLGNLLAKQLDKHEGIEFSAYEVPHPLDNKMEVTFMTSGQDPTEAMRLAVLPAIDLLDNLKECFDSAIQK